MIKHVVTMDKDDLERVKDSTRAIREALRRLDESHAKDQIAIDVGIIEDILGIEPPPIPEAVTARWHVSRDSINCATHIRCTNCNEMRSMYSPSHAEPVLPSVCPNCKAVMTGVE